MELDWKKLGNIGTRIEETKVKIDGVKNRDVVEIRNCSMLIILIKLQMEVNRKKEEVEKNRKFWSRTVPGLG